MKIVGARWASLTATLMLAVGLLTVSTVVGAGHAEAAVTCKNVRVTEGSAWKRSCKVDQGKAGAHVQGWIYWTYDTSQHVPLSDTRRGDLTLKVFDTAPDGKCAIIRVRFYDGPGEVNNARSFSACGNGTSKQQGYTLNGGRAKYGKIHVALCTTGDPCRTLFYQDVAQKYPS